MATLWVILFLRDYGYKKISRENLPFISNTVSGCAVCFNIGCPGWEGRLRDSSLVFVCFFFFFLVDSVKSCGLTVIISSKLHLGVWHADFFCVL